MRLLLPTLLAGALAAQAPSVPPGFEAREVVTESASAPAVRAVAFTGDGYLVAIARDLEMRRPGSTPRPLLRLHPGEEFAFVTVTATGRALVGELHSGRITDIDLATGSIRGRFFGPRNAFDAVPLPNGDLLINANPLWPSPGANSGVWLAGPTAPARELLALSGPSAPLVLADNGDLVAAELGIVLPPPGTARVLRFPAALLQQAIAGGVFTTAQAIDSATGYSGIYDLAFDDLGRLHSTDPASSAVVHTAPGTLTPGGTTLDVGTGRSALWLSFVDHPTAPFRGFQPGDHAPSLLVSHSDFAQHFATTRMLSARPSLHCSNAGAVPPGASPLAIDGSPPLGLAAVIATWSPPVPENVVASIGGVPLWLGISVAASVPLQLLSLDAQGAAATTFTNPGGYSMPLHLQAVVLGPPGTAELGSSPLLSLQLLP